MRRKIILNAPLDTPSDSPVVAGEPLLIDLQGSFQLSLDNTPLAPDAKPPRAPIARLDLSDPIRPRLAVGYHLLTGKIASVYPPLALIRHGTDNHEIVAFIRRKIQFSSRPEPVSISHGDQIE